MIAVGGFAKALPPHGAGYDFANAGAMETRFMGITWLESNYRVRWRWNDEALFHDLDGTFADQPFCAGCHVLKNPIVSNAHSFPECYQDEVCAAPHVPRGPYVAQVPTLPLRANRRALQSTALTGACDDVSPP